jgi:hypothetical protein
VTPAFSVGLLPLLAGLLAAGGAEPPDTVTRLVIQDEVILRVPVVPRPPTVRQVRWIARKGPKCIPSTMVRRALLSGPNQVDFILANRTRLRARFGQQCPALDFYSGLYLKPQDARLCVQRDAIHSRAGGSCTIDEFLVMIPQLRQVATLP